MLALIKKIVGNNFHINNSTIKIKIGGFLNYKIRYLRFTILTSLLRVANGVYYLSIIEFIFSQFLSASP